MLARFVLIAMVLTACGGETEKPATPAPAGDLIEVTDDGANIEPPAEKASLPEGAWICDMGTVHYARAKKGDGACPRCGMNLVEHKSH